MWYNRLTEYLLKQGYNNDPICPCVFIKRYQSQFVIIAVYVDDLNIIGTPGEFQKAANCLKLEFEMKDLGRTRFCLGLQIEHLKDGIFMHQSTYISNILYVGISIYQSTYIIAVYVDDLNIIGTPEEFQKAANCLKLEF